MFLSLNLVFCLFCFAFQDKHDIGKPFLLCFNPWISLMFLLVMEHVNKYIETFPGGDRRPKGRNNGSTCVPKFLSEELHSSGNA